MQNPNYFETSLHLIFNPLEILHPLESREVKFTLVPNPLPPIQQICSSMYIHEKCLIVCASTGLESETVLSSLLVSCACERSESQTSMRFSLGYTSI